MKKIIVAGGGHGGIATAAILAKNGFDVTVYEGRKRENMGYDWTDCFDKNGLKTAGIPLPAEGTFGWKKNMTFYSADLSTPIYQDIPSDNLELQMERREIYNLIISHAESCGVKFEYETQITSPVILGDRVVGIKTAKGDIYADLVIDACGIDSVIRTNLPGSFGIQKAPVEYETFYAYRAFFNRVGDMPEDEFKVIMLCDNKMGVSWVASDDEYADVLVGRFESFDLQEVELSIENLRKTNPCIGTEKLRGGEFVKIPVRQPLAVLVANGYAAIGDSAFMTVPVIGSGIANSLKAAKILADVIMADKSGNYSAASLWPYQRKFYNKLGSGLAPIAHIKLFLTRLEGPQLDYIFRTGILSAGEMTIGADCNNFVTLISGMKISDILKVKLKGIINDPHILMMIMRMGADLAKTFAVLAAMPQIYNKQAVELWAKSYNSCFRH